MTQTVTISAPPLTYEYIKMKFADIQTNIPGIYKTYVCTDVFIGFSLLLWFRGITTFDGYLIPNPTYTYITRGAFNKFPDFFCTGI